MLSTLPLRLKVLANRTSGFLLQFAAGQDIALGDLGLRIFARHFHSDTSWLAVSDVIRSGPGYVYHGYRQQHACH